MRTLPILAAILAVGLGTGATKAATDEVPGFDYREAMRAFVQAISAYARAGKPDFILVPQNGLELLTKEGWPASGPAAAYVAAIDGVAQEHVFYGMTGYGEPVPGDARAWLNGLLDFAESQGLSALVADYADARADIDDAHAAAAALGYILFVGYGEDFNLDNIPPYPVPPVGANGADVRRLAEARNFLYLINSARFETKEDFIAAVAATDYDLVIMDAFHGSEPWSAAEVARLQVKPGGGRRLAIAYMNIGLAEDFRYYWQDGWRLGEPAWIAADYDSEYFGGEYWIHYWEPAWHRIIYGSPESYIHRIIGAGFDGVYLDNIEAYAFFEDAEEEDDN